MINYDLNKIKAIIFDIDGVLSAETITMGNDGVPQLFKINRVKNV